MNFKKIFLNIGWIVSIEKFKGVGKFWIGLREPDFSRNDLIQMWPISKGEYSI